MKEGKSLELKITQIYSTKFKFYHELKFTSKKHHGFILVDKKDSTRISDFSLLQKGRKELRLCDIIDFKDETGISFRGHAIHNLVSFDTINGKEVYQFDFSDRAENKYYRICPELKPNLFRLKINQN